MAAYAAGIKTVLIPADNEVNLEEVDEEVRANIKFIPCRHASEVLSHALVTAPSDEIFTENGKSDESFESTYIKMSMPKFRIEYETSLNQILKNMGITTAFDDETADFTKMFDKGNMWFTETIHKTYIDVNEKGTEAAAVTAVGMAGSALPPEPIELKFNKPFYFAIRDNTSGEILFMGRYAFAK